MTEFLTMTTPTAQHPAHPERPPPDGLEEKGSAV